MPAWLRPRHRRASGLDAVSRECEGFRSFILRIFKTGVGFLRIIEEPVEAWLSICGDRGLSHLRRTGRWWRSRRLAGCGRAPQGRGRRRQRRRSDPGAPGRLGARSARCRLLFRCCCIPIRSYVLLGLVSVLFVLSLSSVPAPHVRLPIRPGRETHRGQPHLFEISTPSWPSRQPRPSP